MPIYEYECSRCHQTSDSLQKVNDPAPETCPRCGAQHTLSRLLSRTSFVLKGGGWYADLYSSSKSKEAESSEPKTPAKTESATPPAPSTPSTGGGDGGSSGSGSSGSGPSNSAPKVAAAKA